MYTINIELCKCDLLYACTIDSLLKATTVEPWTPRSKVRCATDCASPLLVSESGLKKIILSFPVPSDYFYFPFSENSLLLLGKNVSEKLTEIQDAQLEYCSRI